MSDPYPKIHAPFKRHREGPNKGRFILGEWSLPELEYLASNKWVWTEKVDGTNIRLTYEYDGSTQIRGRSDNAQIPRPLLTRLTEIVETVPWTKAIKFDGSWTNHSATLYGEGYGPGIQKVGVQYGSSVDFVLFDVAIWDGERTWWLDRLQMEEIGLTLGLDVVDIVLEGSIYDAIDLVCHGFDSAWPGVVVPEGLVGRPVAPLYDRHGNRITTKVKHVDFKEL